jgi:ketosteroid isomerase-like protein
MPTTLPKTIAAYFAATNARDTAAVVACFAPDAVVVDERREMRGRAAIRAWRERTFGQYRYTSDVIDATAAGERIVVTARVAGDFPGSPVDLHFAFALAGDQIAALEIRP